MLTYHGLRLGGLIVPPLADTSRDFPPAATALAVAWVAMALLVLLLLRNESFPQSLPICPRPVTSRCSPPCCYLADGPRSPLVVGYFLLLALAATRFDLRLLWFALAGCLAGYLVVLGYAKWFAKRDIMVARHSELIFGLALLLWPSCWANDPPRATDRRRILPANGSCGRTSMTIPTESAVRSLCAQCGATVGLDDQYCWLCGARMGAPAGSCHRRRRRRKPKTIGRSPSARCFLIVTIACICLGLCVTAPGLGILLTVALLPA